MPRKKRKRAPTKGKVGRLMASAEDSIPAEFLQKWPGYFRPLKKPITLRVDADVLAWFKKQGRGYQTRINRALRKVMAEER
ncbi:MAG: BrnA antitoxin family protein [Terriglobales bacterium]|jgi:uncharacterized protein (DUF4415 family)